MKKLSESDLKGEEDAVETAEAKKTTLKNVCCRA